MSYVFWFGYNTVVYIAVTVFALDLNKSVIKRVWSNDPMLTFGLVTAGSNLFPFTVSMRKMLENHFVKM